MNKRPDPKRLKRCRGRAVGICDVCKGPACKDAQRYDCQECCYRHKDCIMYQAYFDVMPFIEKMGGLLVGICRVCEDSVTLESHSCPDNSVDWLDIMRRLK